MPYEFRLPDLGEGIAEAEIRRWLVQEGDAVAEHQGVLEVETDKAVVELPSPKMGRILRRHGAPGEMVPVGAVLLTLDLPEEGGGAAPPSFGIVGVLPEGGEARGGEHDSAEPLRAMPAVRALARELGIDLATVKGSGPQGSVTREDVLREAGVAGSERGKVPGGTGRIPLRGIRRSIARHLLRAQERTAFVTTMEEVDVTPLWELKVREEKGVAERGLHLTFLPFFIKATQHALTEHPLLNATVDEKNEAIVLQGACHMGVAIDTVEGLLVPVIRDVAGKSILDLAAALKDLAERRGTRHLRREELQGSTFTLTNFGGFGGGFATPIINYPNVAILGCGRIVEKPWVVGGEIRVRRILTLSLTFDHRVADGAEATRFLSRVASYLADPGLLFIESL